MQGDMRRRRWPLRYRLATLVIALLAAVGAVIGVVPTLARRSSLLAQLDSELVEQGRAQREGGHHTDHGADGGEQCDDERREAVTERPAPASHVTLHPPA